MRYTLNVVPILYYNATIPVEKFPYSEIKFEELHRQSRNSHLIKRSGNEILAVPLNSLQASLGGVIDKIQLGSELSLVRSLANHALYRALLEKECWISGVKPLSYFIPKTNLLEDCIPQGLTQVKGLSVFVKWELEFRVIKPLKDDAYVAMSINIGTTPRISINCYQLMASGFPIIGYYIGKPHNGKNPDLKPRFSTIGRVRAVDSNGVLELDDVKDGQPNQVDPTEVYLEPREDLLESCIRYFYKDRALEILRNLENKLSTYNSGNTKLSKIENALKHYQQFNLELIEGCKFQFGDFLTDNANQSKHIEIYNAEKPLFVYSHGATKTSNWNDLGLQNYGPFSRETFSPSKPRICLIFQSNKKGQVEQILHKFLNGIPPVPYGKNGKTFEYTGLKNKFRLQDCTVDFFAAEDDTIESYNKAISAALQVSGGGRGFDLALIQIDHSFRARPSNSNPYLAAKARFLGQQIPVQEFTLENLGQPDQRIVWSINNMALATYAKLGGVPWLLTADSTIAHEVVFGIGSAMIHNSRLGVKERMIGITTVFTGDGNYYVNNVSSAVYSDKYFETLTNSLRQTMERVKKDFNWRERDTVRLIFHAFKTFKDVEADAVKQVMSELGDFNVEYAFVHVAPNHPYLLFDRQQKGINGKGIYAPERTKFLQLSEHVSLVSLTGANELKKVSDGLPNPIQLILHRDSTFKDMVYLSKQVIKFGAHSWRSFAPAPMPVSVYYSQLMAQMLSQLDGVNSWNNDAIFNKIGKTRWFL